MTLHEFDLITQELGLNPKDPRFHLKISSKLRTYQLSLLKYTSHEAIWIYDWLTLLKQNKQAIFFLVERYNRKVEAHLKHTHKLPDMHLAKLYQMFNRQLGYIMQEVKLLCLDEMTPNDLRTYIFDTQQYIAQLNLEYQIQEKINLVKNL